MAGRIAANPFDQLLLDALRVLGNTVLLLGKIATSRSKYADDSAAVFSQATNVLHRGRALFAARDKGADQ